MHGTTRIPHTAKSSVWKMSNCVYSFCNYLEAHLQHGKERGAHSAARRRKEKKRSSFEDQVQC